MPLGYGYKYSLRRLFGLIASICTENLSFWQGKFNDDYTEIDNKVTGGDSVEVASNSVYFDGTAFALTTFTGNVLRVIDKIIITSSIDNITFVENTYDVDAVTNIFRIEFDNNRFLYGTGVSGSYTGYISLVKLKALNGEDFWIVPQSSNDNIQYNIKTLNESEYLDDQLFPGGILTLDLPLSVNKNLTTYNYE